MAKNNLELLTAHFDTRIDKGEVIEELFYDDHEEEGFESDLLHTRVTAAGENAGSYEVFRFSENHRQEEMSRVREIAEIFAADEIRSTHLLLPNAYFFDEESGRYYYTYPAVDAFQLYESYGYLAQLESAQDKKLSPQQRRGLGVVFARQIGATLDLLRQHDCYVSDFGEYIIYIDTKGDFFIRIDNTSFLVRPGEVLEEDDAEFLAEKRKSDAVTFFKKTMQLLVTADATSTAISKAVSVGYLFDKDRDVEGAPEFLLDFIDSQLESLGEDLGQSADEIYDETRALLVSENLEFLTLHVGYESAIEVTHRLAVLKQELGAPVTEFMKESLRKALENIDTFSFEEFGLQLSQLMEEERLL
jgi:hypothetical protein